MKENASIHIFIYYLYENRMVTNKYDAALFGKENA